MRSPLRSPAQVEGPQSVLPQPEKDLERPSSTRLEARFPYYDLRVKTRSPSPFAIAQNLNLLRPGASRLRAGAGPQRERRQNEVNIVDAARASLEVVRCDR